LNHPPVTRSASSIVVRRAEAAVALILCLLTQPETTSLALDYAAPQPRRYDRRMAALHAPVFFGSMAVALYMLA